MNGRLALVFVGGMACMVVVALAASWLWVRRPAGRAVRPTAYHDPIIADVADPAARAMLDQLAGQVRQLLGEQAYLRNVAEAAQHMAGWAVLRKGNPYDADMALVRSMIGLVKESPVPDNSDPLPLGDPRD